MTILEELAIDGKRTIRPGSTIRLTSGGGGGPRHHGRFIGERGLVRVVELTLDDDGRTWGEVQFIEVSDPLKGRKTGNAIGRTITILLNGPAKPSATIPNQVEHSYSWKASNRSHDKGTA